MQKLDIHNTDRALRNAKKRVLDQCSPRNKKIISDFYVRYSLENNLSKSRILFYLNRIGRYVSWLGKDIDKATRNDIEKYCYYLEYETNYARATKRDSKIAVKIIYKWLGQKKKVKGIKLKSKKSGRLPEEILVEREVCLITEETIYQVYECMVVVGYEGGLRVGELLNMQIKHCDFYANSNGVKLTVNGKTGMRKILVIVSRAYLLAWLENHPDKDNPEAYLWVNTKGNIMQYRIWYKQLRNFAKRAGVRKRVNPHSFRHARATHLANHLTESQMCSFFGWTPGSDMPGLYVHLSGRDIDKAILKAYGIKEDVKEVSYNRFSGKQEHISLNQFPRRKTLSVLN